MTKLAYEFYTRAGGTDFLLLLALIALAVTGIMGLFGAFDPKQTIYRGDDYE